MGSQQEQKKKQQMVNGDHGAMLYLKSTQRPGVTLPYIYPDINRTNARERKEHYYKPISPGHETGRKREEWQAQPRRDYDQYQNSTKSQSQSRTEMIPNRGMHREPVIPERGQRAHQADE